ncbi:3-isopropylmalate dehydratase large subunit [Ottowia thiooxydans]|uniref:3-isopropylmalate dehydratase large subunit n=1 Tax=Ottowia thiooxydans TaxID=219182 RepID=UPI0003F4C059|nr:aconitase family protein [Ottowia thiooxydans]
MGMTAFEKITARAAGLPSVKPGEFVYPRADLMFLHDGQVESTKIELDEIGITELDDPSKVVFVTDHEVVYSTPKAAQRGLRIREAAKAWKVDKFFDVGQGGHGHIFPIEMGLVGPGMFIYANDMHCTNFGAVGAVALRVGTEIANAIAMGELWIKVPSTIRIKFTGQLKAGVYGRDVGYCLARNLADRAYGGVSPAYRVIELAGNLDQFDLAARVALINTATEVGVAHVFIPPTREIVERQSKAAGRPFTGVYSDDDAEYEAEGEFDLSSLEPQVALPGGPERSVDLSSVLGRTINHAFIGSCGSGMYEDMLVAANILRGKRIAPGTRMTIVPGTVATAKRLSEEGLISAFQEAGCIILPPGCGPCAGAKSGSLGAGEVSISTAAVNTAGRMGDKTSEIYLGSPATVAASALVGHIADARAIAA